ncbi:MAG: tetratricopeptide repeat protein [Proteobacteria bacterium]|nr:tetratricopeptide repeat protein [Pseudomonadota bacterium]
MHKSTETTEPNPGPPDEDGVGGNGKRTGEPLDTTHVDLSNAPIIIEDLLDLCEQELAVLASSPGVDENRLADLYLRLALLYWNVPEDADKVILALDRARLHPLTPQLLLSCALTQGKRELLEMSRATAERSLDGQARAAILRDIAEGWLYHFGDPLSAAEVVRSGLDLPADSETSDELRYLLWIALAQGREWRQLSNELVEAAMSENADLATVAEAAHVLIDRLDDPGGARDFIESVATRLAERKPDGDDEIIHRYRLLVMSLDIATATDTNASRTAADLYRQLLGLLERMDDSGPESGAMRFLFGDYLRHSGDLAGAAEIMARLARPDGDGADWGPRLALMVAFRLAQRGGNWQRAVELLRQLADTIEGPISDAYAVRAAEVADARMVGPARSLQSWRLAIDASGGSEQAYRAIECLLVADSPGALIAHFKSITTAASKKRPCFLRRAAAIAESRAKNLDQAIALQTLATENADDMREYQPLLRLYWRKADADALAEVYRILIGHATDTRVSAGLLCALGILQLEIGQPKQAERTFKAAATQAPDDPIAREALAGIYRLIERPDDLMKVLSELVGLVQNQQSLGEILRELGLLQVSMLGEPERARATLERVLTLEPNDAATLHAMARIHDRAREWDQSVALRERALTALMDHRSSRFDVDDLDRAQLYMEIGEIEEKRRRNDEAALRAYEEAFGTNRKLIASLQAQARIYRRQRQLDMVVEILRAELELEPEESRKVPVLLELASLYRDDKAGTKDIDAAIEVQFEALRIDPKSSAALAGMRSIGRAEKRWDIVAKAFRNAPKTAENLSLLAEAYQQTTDWASYVQVRTEQMKLSISDKEKGIIAYELAEVYHRQLGALDPAIAAYKQALAGGVEAENSQRKLFHLLEEHERWDELEQSYEQALVAIAPTDTNQRGRVLMRLGTLRRDRLNKPAEAVEAFEALLKLQPRDAEALEALERLYDDLGQEQNLLQVFATRSEVTEKPEERCQLQMRMAKIRQEQGDTDGAISAYRQAFEAQPSNREVFTVMEKFCYKLERWNDAMWLYKTAIAMVEDGKLRAYRLSDLYARRGQIQLQYLEQLDAAAESYLRMLELDPENDTALKFLESIYSRQHNWTGLIAAYEKRASLVEAPVRRIQVLRRAARIARNKLKNEGEAARLYELLLEIDPSDDEALSALEQRYEQDKNWDRLVGVLQHRLNETRSGEKATELLQRIAHIGEERLHDPKRAIEHYRRILEIAPGNKQALDALGRIYESTEEWTDFIDITRRQIRVTSDRNVKALLYFKCGSVMEAKFGKEEDAIRYYDAAIKTSASCLPAVHGLRDLYRRRKDWKRVIQTLELEVKLWQDDKERAGVFAQIGRIYSDDLAQPDRALHYYESALSVDPECVPANKALFELYFAQGDWEQAHPLAQKLAQKVVRDGDPTTRSEFYRKCGIVSEKIGDPRTGAETLIVALEIKPTNLQALDAFVELAKTYPNAYEDYEPTLRELEKIYRKRDDSQPHLARVRVAQALILEGEGDLEGAEKLYADAIEMCRDDFAIVSALVNLHTDMRRWHLATDAINQFLVTDPPPQPEIRLQALMLKAEIHADYEMDPRRAISVIKEILELRPDYEEAHYRLAQQQYVLRRFDEARRSIERVIELAAAPGTGLSPESLARYYYYRGRIIETSGDSRRATSQYRRANEYDPAYAPPALALAKRAAKSGDQRQAETLLINAAHAAMVQSGPEAAVTLQRGLARILLDSGDRSAAIEAYRGILNVQPDSADDRVALAEIYAMEDLIKAISELKKVIHRDIYHAPAYRMLASLYAQEGENARAYRALSVMDMLGFAEEDDRSKTAKLRVGLKNQALQGALTDELRAELLITEAATEPFGEIFIACASEITALFGQKVTGENLVPIQTIEDRGLHTTLAQVIKLYGVEPDIYVGEQIPGEVIVMAYPRRLVIVERSLLDASDAGRRFLFGWAFEAIRGGYALLVNLGRRQRSELGSLLQALLLPEDERSGPTNDFVNSLPKESAKVISRHAGTSSEIDPDLWIDRMLAIAKRAGLAACNDFQAATTMIARINGEHPESQEDIIALGAVMGGPDLVRFYLADEYHKLREILMSRSPGPNV